MVHVTCSVTAPTVFPWKWVTESGVSLGCLFNLNASADLGLMKFPVEPESSITFTSTASFIQTLVKNCLVMEYGVSLHSPISTLSTVDTFVFSPAATSDETSFLTFYQNPIHCPFHM
jgi:hypothetical protein